MTYYMEDLKKRLSDKLSKERYEHTIGVADTSACLAMRYGCHVEDAYIAGLLHDNAKCLNDEKLMSECKKYNLSVNDVETKSPYLLHGKLGAYYAKQNYGIEDEGILSAIAYHTTGKTNMNLLEMIVFVADYIEPNRKMIPGLENIRKVAFMNIEESVYLILESTLKYLEKKGLTGRIEYNTVAAYEYYSTVVNKEM